MAELTDVIQKHDKIIQGLAPEIDNIAQRILYGTALSILNGDVERFRQVLQNAEKLQPYRGSWTGYPELGLVKGSYAVVLALNGNDVDKAKSYDETAERNFGNNLQILPLARIAVAHADRQKI